MKRLNRLIGFAFFSTFIVVSVLCNAEKTIRPVKTFWHNQVRELRYKPDGDAFVNHNGDKRFTRAIYGTNTAFRFETSDFPEFGLYLPNFGGSMYLAISTKDTCLWVKDLKNIESRFVSGMRSYILTDTKILGNGSLTITALALSDGDGLILKSEPKNCPPNMKLIWVYGGANDDRFSRSGDLGADPANSFYIESQKCKNNLYTIRGNEFTMSYAGGMKHLTGVFPKESVLKIVDGAFIDNLSALVQSKSSLTPLLMAEYPVASEPFYVEIHNPESRNSFAYNQLPEAFSKGESFRKAIASRVKINTPDAYLNTLGGIISGAEDAVWESPGYLHGAIGWRMPLTGWRASYLADVLGLHERARTHFNGYANAQVTNKPVTLPPMQDKNLNLARSEKTWGTPMYSNGYICRNPNKPNSMHHYDMNLVYIDELLWHLNWTGDWEYAREIFPVIKSHLAWEKLVFDPDNDGLYDGYCCIWASDGLQYNGGVATHSTAYNYRANKIAAMIAEKLGQDPTIYQKEASLILTAINKNLWLKDKGWWAEFKDNMGHKLVHEDAAIWSIYHAIDSDIHDTFKAYQATRYVDTEIPHIPVHAVGLSDTSNYVISTTDWQPYMWSINNVAFAEITHTALAFWQSGRCDEAYKMFKGTILDAMYLGSGPGNITQISYYDAARGETYRDFADPVATAARAVVQGMFGILPDLLQNKLTIRPGFPDNWNHASLETQNMTYRFVRKGLRDTYFIEPKLLEKSALTFEVNAHRDKIKSLTVNGVRKSFTLLDNAVARPKVLVEAGKALKYEIVIEWSGKAIDASILTSNVAIGDTILLPLPATPNQVFDPQTVLENSEIKGGKLFGIVCGEKGHRTVFVKTHRGSMSWWQPMDLNVQDAVELVNKDNPDSLSFQILNRSNKQLVGDMFVNNSPEAIRITLAAKSSQSFTFGSDASRFGTNQILLQTSGKSYSLKAINWNLPNPAGTRYEKVDLSGFFNEKVRDIFAYGKYLTPRWPYTTLQVPTQGMGQWCHPEDLSSIDDRGIRTKAGVNNTFMMPQGIPFATPGDSTSRNVAFTTLWDNYPHALTIPVSGKASRVYLLVAASTYHMQSNFLNGTITALYKDGTKSVLNLVLPDNLLPLDQDIYTDGYAFKTKEPRPYRVRLKTGDVSKNHAADLGKSISNDPIIVDGGMATVLDLPLNPNKELESISVETIANEVIIGLMSATLVRN